MILSDFLSRQKQDDSNPYEIIPISFHMQNILESRYCNISVREEGRYLVQTRSQAKFSGITLPEVHGVTPEKKVVKPLSSEVKCISQIKPKLGQGRACIKQNNLNFLCPHCLINQNNHRYYQVEGPSYK